MRKTFLAAALVAPAAVIGALAASDPGRPPAAPPAEIVAVAYAHVPDAPATVPAAAHSAAALPTIAVQPLVVHAAPSDADSRPAQPYTVVPLKRALAERSLPRPAPRRPRRIGPAALESGRALVGPATEAGGTALQVDGRRVRLFGIRLEPRDNGTAARAALARHLAAAPAVTCDAPSGQPGRPEFVCHDRAGVDLGQMLVRQGWAVADRTRSYQYVGDEERARTRRAGLWAKR
ncbi:MAG TPA: hypothetical protein VFX06_00250 [Stellaceae bacterium]|nr:hypothetical protein [Stellaceae bacterium]